MLRSANPSDTAFDAFIAEAVQIVVVEEGKNEVDALAILDGWAASFGDRWSTHEAMRIRAIVAEKFSQKNTETPVPNEGENPR